MGEIELAPTTPINKQFINSKLKLYTQIYTQIILVDNYLDNN